MSRVEHRLIVKYDYYGRELELDHVTSRNVQHLYDLTCNKPNVEYVIWESRVIPDWEVVKNHTRKD